MRMYKEAYIHVLKKNFMLLIIEMALLLLTFAFWIGIPYFIVGNFLSEINTPIIIQGICITLSVGLLFSVYFIPLNVKVAKKLVDTKRRSTTHLFMRLQLAFVVVSGIITWVIISLIYWIQVGD